MHPTPHPRRRPRRRGYILMLAMTMIGIIAIFVTALLGMASTSLRTTNRRLTGKQALNLAQSGLDYAAARVSTDSAYPGFSSTALGAGTVSATVITPAGQPTARIVDATAVVTASGYSARRTVRAHMDTGPIPPVFYHALAARTSFSLGGDVRIDSHPTPAKGDVHCNQNVTHNGGGAGLVDGTSTASGTVVLSGSPTITGGTQSGVPPMQFPEIGTGFKEQSLANGVTSGNVIVGNGSVVKGKIVGNLTINNPNGAQISGVVWVTGTVDIRGPVTGSGALVCDGTMEIDTRTYDPLTDPARVAFLTTSTDRQAINLKGNRAFKGILYAPYGTAKIQGNPDLYGAVIANTIDFGGTPHITRWTNFDTTPPPLPRFSIVRGYEEL